MALEAAGLVKGACRGILDSCQQANAGEAEFAGEDDGPLEQRTADALSAPWLEHMEFVEVEEAEPIVELGHANEKRPSDGLPARDSEQTPSRRGVEDVVVLQAASRRFRGASADHRILGMVLGLDLGDEGDQRVTVRWCRVYDAKFGVHGVSLSALGSGVHATHAGRSYTLTGGTTMPSFPRFLFRVKDRQIEEEARKMIDAFGIKDVEIRRDDTIKDAWFEDSQALKTTFGLDDIREYLEELTSG